MNARRIPMALGGLVLGLFLAGTPARSAEEITVITQAKEEKQGAPARSAEEMGAAFEVAPKVEGTTCQATPAAAWSAGAKCWLAAWREGELNELSSDVWCARVGEDGKPLDPAGVPVCRQKDVQERPVVASDGKSFLVVWQDMRNGKDWDVYAARVSDTGKVLDPDGFLVAGGEQNQCLPQVAFGGGNYYVVWMNLTGADGANPCYVIVGARVSPEGKALDQPISLISLPISATEPSLAATGDRFLVSARTRKEAYSYGLYCVSVEAATGKPVGPAQDLSFKGGDAIRVVFGGDSGFQEHHIAPNTIIFCPLDATGKRKSETPTCVPTGGEKNGWYRFQQQSFATVFDGERYLHVIDWVTAWKLPNVNMEVAGWFLDREGKPLNEKPFMVAEGPNWQTQVSAAAGPKGRFLVLWREEKSPDEAKIMVRLVSAK